MSFKKGQNWGETETRTFLELCIERQIVRLMDEKKHKHLDILSTLVPIMESKGYSKTAEQMRLKLKTLKLGFFKCRKSSTGPNAVQKCLFYDELETLLSSRLHPDHCMYSVMNNSSLEMPVFKDDEVMHFTSIKCDDNNIDMIDDEEDIDADDDVDGDSSPPEKKMKLSTPLKTGRRSYQSTLETYSEKWLESQRKIMEAIMERQGRSQQLLIESAMEKQREWEEQEMEKERQFQKEQTEMIMKAFVQAMRRY